LDKLKRVLLRYEFLDYGAWQTWLGAT